MTTNGVSVRRALSVAAIGAIDLALLARTGTFSTSYRLAVAAGAVMFGLATFTFFGRRPFHRFIIAAPRAVRGVIAVAPWTVLVVIILTTDPWWSQQYIAAKLLAAYAMTAWSSAWCAGADRESGAVSGLLAGLAALFFVAGLDGILFGLTRFGVVLSAVLANVAALHLVVARFASRATRSRVAAATASMLIGVVIAEAGIRALHLGETLQEVDNPEYVRLFHNITPPRSSFLNRPTPLDEFAPALIEINSRGVRGPEIEPGPVDLLLIGDSFVEARQLPWEETISARLPAVLKARSSPARVVGHGMRGWSPLLEWNWYLKAGRTFHPRTVLLFFFWNDLWPTGDEAHTFHAVLRPDGRPDSFNELVEPDWVWFKHARTVRLVEEMLQRVSVATLRRSLASIGRARTGLDLADAEAAAKRMGADARLSPEDVQAILTRPLADLTPRLRTTAGADFWPGMRPLALWDDPQRQAAAVAEHELDLFAQDVAADGGRLVLVYVPNAYQVARSECQVARHLVGLDEGTLLPEDSGVESWLRKVGERHGLDVLDASAAMRAFDRSADAGSGSLYLRADCHWSARGHQFMADYLADWYLSPARARK